MTFEAVDEIDFDVGVPQPPFGKRIYELLVKLGDVDHFLFHQANLRINEAVAAALEIPAEKCPNNIERYGNCSAASIPMLLDENVRSGRIRRGDLVAMASFGSGFSWTGALLRW